MRSSTSRTVPKSCANCAQSSWVTPESISTGTPFGSSDVPDCGLLSQFGSFGGVLFNIDAQGAVLAAALELEIDEVQIV